MPSQAKIIIAGGSGLIGSAFSREAVQKGYWVSLLTRNGNLPPNKKSFDEAMVWNPQEAIRHKKERAALVRVMNSSEVIINLAGSSIAAGRLNRSHIQNVRESRLLSTNALLQVYSECLEKPKIWIQASAVGYYGSRHEETLTEKKQSRFKPAFSNLCKMGEYRFKE